jgi:hypothetical protein
MSKVLGRALAEARSIAVRPSHKQGPHEWTVLAHLSRESLGRIALSELPETSHRGEKLPPLDPRPWVCLRLGSVLRPWPETSQALDCKRTKFLRPKERKCQLQAHLRLQRLVRGRHLDARHAPNRSLEMVLRCRQLAGSQRGAGIPRKSSPHDSVQERRHLTLQPTGWSPNEMVFGRSTR